MQQESILRLVSVSVPSAQSRKHCNAYAFALIMAKCFNKNCDLLRVQLRKMRIPPLWLQYSKLS